MATITQTKEHIIDNIIKQITTVQVHIILIIGCGMKIGAMGILVQLI